MIARLVPAGTLLTRVEGLTLAFTYFTAGLAVSVFHVTEGTTPLTVMAAAFLVNSATSTLAFAAVTGAGGSTVAGVLSGWLVATRFGLFAAVIGPRLWPERWKRALSAHFSFDPTVALAQREPTDDRVRRAYLASGLWLCLPWWTAGAVGALIGNRIGDTDAIGLDAVLPAMLLAIIWPQLRDRWPIALLGVGIAVVLFEFAPAGVPVLAAGGASLLALRKAA